MSSLARGISSLTAPLEDKPSFASTQRTLDGSLMRWHTDEPRISPVMGRGRSGVPVMVSVSPVKPGHTITVEYRDESGLVREVSALGQPHPHDSGARMFLALLPTTAGTPVEFLPVLRLAGQPISQRLAAPTRHVRPGPLALSAPRSARDAGPPLASSTTTRDPAARAAGGTQPRWAWDTRLLGCLTAIVRKEVVGATPDGMRIDWHVVEGTFVGPGLEAVVLPGATDWMRIRTDGVGVVSVQACFETRKGVRIYGSYGGYFDLGPDGYERALRDEFDPLPPVVVTPTYATADPQLEWLNRAQCLGVGRVDMKALRVEFDVYLIHVGGPAPGP